MRFIILSFLYISVIIIKHLQWKNLLTGDSGKLLGYINVVFFYPLASAFIIAAVVCVIIRKTRANQIIVGTNYAMAMLLIVSSATWLWNGSSWTYTAPGAPITITLPNKEWKTTVTTPHGYRMTVVMKDIHAGISVISDTPDASNIHSFEDLLTAQQIKFKEGYHADAFKLHPCSVNGFQCAYQDYILTTENGLEKRALSMSLLDKTHFVQVMAVIDLDYVDQYYDEVMAILQSAKKAE